MKGFIETLIICSFTVVMFVAIAYAIKNKPVCGTIVEVLRCQSSKYGTRSCWVRLDNDAVIASSNLLGSQACR